MVPPVPAGVEIPPEPPDVGARALSVASRHAVRRLHVLLPGVPVRLLLPALDQRRPHVAPSARQAPSQALGAAFIVCIVLSAALAIVAGRRMKASSPGWLAPGVAGVVLGLAAVALQCIEYTVQHFGPTNGAYASVFCAWTAST